MHHSIEADQLVRLLGLAKRSAAPAGQPGGGLAGISQPYGARAQAAAIPRGPGTDGLGQDNAGRGLAIGLGLSAILWMVLLAGAYLLAR